MSSFLTQKSCRQQGQKARRALQPAQRRNATARLNRRLSYQLRSAKRIAVYLHFDGEPDLLPCIAQLLQRGRQVYVPQLRKGKMQFVSYQTLGQPRINRYGIIEPKRSAAKLSSKRLQAVVMPLTAYDRLGTRVGMGAGYYDRNLQWRQSRTQWQGPQLIGAAWQCQESPRITRDDWDIPMDSLVNEQETLVFRNNK